MKTIAKERAPYKMGQIPESMQRERRWLPWRYQVRNGKRTKPPIAPATVNNPKSWLSFDEAMDAWAANPNADGVGFVLGDGWVGIDLDNCIGEGGELPEIARDLVGLETYTEVSPSGNGLHALMRGTIPESRRFAGRDGVAPHEIYGSGRYFTVTGDHLSGAAAEVRDGAEAQAALDVFFAKWYARKARPAEVTVGDAPAALPDEKILDLLHRAKNRTKFVRLWLGDISGCASPSEADCALVGMLRFYTQDAGQIGRLFRRSGLMRPKWDEGRNGSTYGADTIAEVIANGGTFYVPPDTAWKRTAYGRRIPLWWSMCLKGYGETAARVLMYLAAHADENGSCWPSVPTMAADLEVAESTISKAMAKLKAGGFLRSSRRFSDSNRYDLIYVLAPSVVFPCV